MTKIEVAKDAATGDWIASVRDDSGATVYAIADRSKAKAKAAAEKFAPSASKPIPTTTRINALLKRAGYAFRLVRGHGYYYLHGEGAGCLYASSLYSYRLTPEDFEYALREVNDMLAESGLRTI